MFSVVWASAPKRTGTLCPASAARPAKCGVVVVTRAGSGRVRIEHKRMYRLPNSGDRRRAADRAAYIRQISQLHVFVPVAVPRGGSAAATGG